MAADTPVFRLGILQRRKKSLFGLYHILRKHDANYVLNLNDNFSQAEKGIHPSY